MTDEPSPERMKEIQWAYMEMKLRGWGFTSNGRGFGDPRATLTMVGPFDGDYVKVLAMDEDCVEAVRKAILADQRRVHETDGIKSS